MNAFVVAEALFLYLSCRNDTFAYGSRRLSGLHLAEFGERHGLYLTLNVDAVEQRPGDFAVELWLLLHIKGLFVELSEYNISKKLAQLKVFIYLCTTMQKN